MSYSRKVETLRILKLPIDELNVTPPVRLVRPLAPSPRPIAHPDEDGA